MKVKSLTESLEKLIENRYVEKEPSNILEAIDNILGKLNEAEMSPEDARDTELLKSARHKIAGKKTNAKNLTPEEQEVLAKYGLDAWGYKGETKMVTPGKTELFQGNDHYGRPGYGWGRSNSDSFSEPKDSWNGRSVRSSRGGSYDKANFADRARKLDARAENQPYKDLTAARHTDEVSMRSKYGVDKIRRAKETADYHADALRDLDNAEAEAKAQAQRKYDNTMERIADQEERQKEVKQKAQDRIDAILAKHRKEVVESLQHFLRTLNEANMSDEDRRDSETIKDITLKLMKRRNAKLTDEEKAILDKYGITNTGGVLRTAGGRVMPRPDHNLRPGRANELVSRAHQGDNLDKVNLADYARKADGREAKRKEMYAPYWDEHTAINHDEKNIDSRFDSGSTQRQVKVKQTANMASDYDAMASALDDRKRADLNIKQLQKDRGDALEQKRSDEKRAESRTVSNREYHTDRLKKHTAEKDRLIAAKKAQFSKKNESLNEAKLPVDRSDVGGQTVCYCTYSKDDDKLGEFPTFDDALKAAKSDKRITEIRTYSAYNNGKPASRFKVVWKRSEDSLGESLNESLNKGDKVPLTWHYNTILNYMDDSDVLEYSNLVGKDAEVVGTEWDDYLEKAVIVVRLPNGKQFNLTYADLGTDIEQSKRAFNSVIKERHLNESLNEDRRSREDAQDSYVLRSIAYKVSKDPDADLSPDEEDIIDKYSLVINPNGRLTTQGGSIIPVEDDLIRHPWDGTEFRSRIDAPAPYSGLSKDKYRSLNLADYARKADDREAKRDENGPNYFDELDAKRYNARNIPDMENAKHWSRVRQTAAMVKDHEDAVRQIRQKRNESLNEAAGNVRIVETGLSGDLGKEIIDSIIGQMSDGIWENAPYMEYYWPNVDATDNGDIEVSTDWTSKWNQRENKFRNMSDPEVRKFFANKLKAIVQEYLNDTNQNPYTNFNADNEEVCSYLGGHVVSDITVGQAYEAYNILRK